MSSTDKVQGYICTLYTKQMIDTCISLTDLNNDDPTNPWIHSPVTTMLGIPLKFRIRPSADHDANINTTLGYRKNNHASQILTINHGIKSADYGTYTNEPLTEDILIVRADGQDLDGNILLDVIEYLKQIVYMSIYSFVAVLEKTQTSNGARRNVMQLVTKGWAKRSWDLWRQWEVRERFGSRIGRENPFA